ENRESFFHVSAGAVAEIENDRTLAGLSKALFERARCACSDQWNRDVVGGPRGEGHAVDLCCAPIEPLGAQLQIGRRGTFAPDDERRAALVSCSQPFSNVPRGKRRGGDPVDGCDFITRAQLCPPGWTAG